MFLLELRLCSLSQQFFLKFQLSKLQSSCSVLDLNAGYGCLSLVLWLGLYFLKLVFGSWSLSRGLASDFLALLRIDFIFSPSSEFFHQLRLFAVQSSGSAIDLVTRSGSLDLEVELIVYSLVFVLGSWSLDLRLGSVFLVLLKNDFICSLSSRYCY